MLAVLTRNRDQLDTAVAEQGLSAGFVSELARLTPHYSEGGEGAPATIIAKLPSLDPATEALATSLHLYERENWFYQETALPER